MRDWRSEEKAMGGGSKAAPPGRVVEFFPIEENQKQKAQQCYWEKEIMRNLYTS